MTGEPPPPERNGRWVRRDDLNWCRDLEAERWRAHEELHKTANVVRQKTDAELNDVRQRFVARDVYDAQRQADQRLFLGMLGVVVVMFGSALGAVVALVR